MKNFFLLFIFCLPAIVFAEYNGVHLEFDIELNDGSKVHGYKYVAHGKNTEDYRKYLEKNYSTFLQNQFTYEPGTHSFYTKRLSYNYNGVSVYKLIKPTEIKLTSIKIVSITKMIVASYAIQIVGNYNPEDQLWMQTEPIIKYSEHEDLCTYDIFIHKTGSTPKELITKIKTIVKETEIKIQKELELLNTSENYEDLYRKNTQLIYKAQNSALSKLIKDSNCLKSVIISLCTC